MCIRCHFCKSIRDQDEDLDELIIGEESEGKEGVLAPR